MDKTTLVFAFLIAAVLAGVFVRFNVLGSFMPSSTEHFMQQPAGMPLNATGMGPYDQVSLEGGVSGWAATEGMPVNVSNLPSSSADPNKLMLLADNKVGADCCPSAFSNDMGCVCLTPSDQSFFAGRGGNRT
jgi:hypothetical protein